MGGGHTLREEAIFMLTVQNGDYDDEMERDSRENHHEFDFTDDDDDDDESAEVLPAELFYPLHT